MDRVVEQLNPNLTNDASRRIVHFLSAKDRLSLSSVNRQALVDSFVYREGLDIRAKLRRATRRLYVWPTKTPSSDDQAILYRGSANSVRDAIFRSVIILLSAIQVIELHDDTTTDSVEALEAKLKEVDFHLNEVGPPMIFQSEEEREVVRSQLVELLAVIAPDVTSVSLMSTLTPALYLTVLGEQPEGWPILNQNDAMNEEGDIPVRKIRDAMLQMHMWPVEQNFLTKPFNHRIIYVVHAITSVLPNPDMDDASEWVSYFLNILDGDPLDGDPYVFDIHTESNRLDEVYAIMQSFEDMMDDMEFIREMVPFADRFFHRAFVYTLLFSELHASSVVWD